MERKVLRTGAAVIVCAILLRLLGGIAGASRVSLPPQMASVMLFLQTGRLMRPADIIFTPAPTEGEPTEEETSEEETTEESQPTEQTPSTEEADPPPEEPTYDLPVFSVTDAAAIQIKCGFSYSADLAELLCKPLSWNLADGQPAVLIYHSHATEGYSPTSAYEETSDYHTLDTSQNMISVGAHLASLLESQGIKVIHDTALHDEPSYTDAYTSSRKSVQDYLKAYPTIRLVLDLHRDAYEDEQGNQVAQTVFSQGARIAPLMFVVGTDYGGNHPNWQENLALALKLQTLIDNTCPGICRNINLRSQKFNQDLSPGTLLVEVGSAGNAHDEAMRAVEILASGITQLAHGSS